MQYYLCGWGDARIKEPSRKLFYPSGRILSPSWGISDRRMRLKHANTPVNRSNATEIYSFGDYVS